MSKSFIDSTLSEQEIYELENLIDKRGIDQVLITIAGIAGLKAEHIAHAWQDAHLAKSWDKVSSAVDRVVPTARGL